MTKWRQLFVNGWMVALAAGWASFAQAGVRIESKVMVHEDRPVESVLELQGSRFRINMQDPATGEALSSTIFDGDHIVRLQARDKSYTVMTMADLKAQMEKLEQMKASLPPEAQAKFDKGNVEPVFAFKRASGGDTIAGMTCENYAMTRDGVDSGVACLSTWKHPGLVTKADLEPMIKLAAQMKTLNKFPAGDLQMGPQFDKWPGWPLVTRAPDGKERTRVVKVTRTTFPKSEFEAPADYTQKAAPLIGGPRAHP